jgi:hypothetical protein
VLFLNDSPSRLAAFHIAPVLSLRPCSARSHTCACASVMPGRERMCAASANSCSGESLRGGRPRFGLIPLSGQTAPDQRLVNVRDAHLERRCRLARRYPTIHRCKHPITQILRGRDSNSGAKRLIYRHPESAATPRCHGMYHVNFLA